MSHVEAAITKTCRVGCFVFAGIGIAFLFMPRVGDLGALLALLGIGVACGAFLAWSAVVYARAADQATKRGSDAE